MTFRRARRNEKRAWYKPSTKRLPPTFLIDWHLPNQPIKITSVACFSSLQIFHAWEKCRLADLKKSFYPLFFSAKNKNSQHNLARLREISKVISVGVQGKKFSKKRRHDVLLVLLFWLGELEFEILKFLFFCCLNILLGNFPRFSVHKSLKTKANRQRARTLVFPVYFLQKAKANNQSLP